jgi:hypothetical protein
MATVIKLARPQVGKNPPGIRSVWRRRRWWLVGLLLGLGVLLWLLPAIVAHTRLLRWGLASATSKLRGTLVVESASLGWFSPLTAAGVEIRDAQDRPVLQVAGLSSEKSLLAMLCNRSSLGTIRLERPKLSVALRNGGSSVEDLLANYLASQEPSNPIDLSLEIVDGSATIRDQESRQSWQLEKLQLSVHVPGASETPLEVRGSTRITGPRIADPQHPGRLALAGTLSGASGAITLQADAVPLAMFEQLLTRLAPQTRLDGQLAAKVALQWSGQGNDAALTLSAAMDADRLVLGMAAMEGDQVRLDRLHAVCQAKRRGNRLEVQSSTLDCDLGTLSASGTLQLDPHGLQIAPASLGQQIFDIRGRIDLARLTQMLPGTLHLRDTIQITSGQVELQCSGRRAAAHGDGETNTAAPMVWQGRLEASDLMAVDRGRPLSWPHPIRLVLAAHQTPQGPVLEGLTCESDFFKVQAAATPDHLATAIRFDLKPLADPLSQFFDLGSLGLGGEGWGHLNWTRTAQTQFEADGDLQMRNFQLALPGHPPWSEENVAALLAAKGHGNPGADTRLDLATLQIRSGGDQLDARLLEPVLDLRGGGNWPLDVQLRGQLDRWPARLGIWFATEPWKSSGACQMTAQATVSKDAVALRQAKLTIAPLVLESHGLHVHEPTAELTASGRWERLQQRWQLDSAALATPTLTAQASDAVLSMPGKRPWELTGTVKYQGNLATLSQWFADGAKPSPWRIAGQLAGTAQLQQRAGRIEGNTAADVTDFTVSGGSGQQFREPHLHLTAAGAYQDPRGVLQLSRCTLTSRMTWDAAAGGGLQLGPGELKSTLTDGLLRGEPLDLPCNQGRLLLTPKLRFSGPRAELLLPAGPLAQRMQIDPALGELALKYIAPVLAGATTVQGAFSVELRGCRLPLAAPGEGEVAGRLTLHGVDIGPGSLARELAVLSDHAGPLRLRPESVIAFRMVGGRIYHEGLELQFPDLTIRIHGSVGLDETLALMAEMPIPPKWLGKLPLGKASNQQTISLPITGTLSRPQLDRRVLDEMGRQGP